VLKTQRLYFTIIFLTGDIIITCFSFLLAYYIRFKSVFDVPKGIPELSQYLRLLPFLGVIWLFIFYFRGHYKLKLERSRIDEFLSIFISVCITVILILSLTLYYRVYYRYQPEIAPKYEFSQFVFGLFLTIDTVLLYLLREGVRHYIERARKKGLYKKNIIIAGAGDLGKFLAKKMHAHPELGFNLIGFLDDDPNKADMEYMGVPVIGTLQDFTKIVAHKKIEQLYIALPLRAQQKTFRLIQHANREGIAIMYVPDLLQFVVLKAGLEELDGIPMINLTSTPLGGWKRIIKRLMDIILSIAGLLLMILLYPIVAPIIKLSSKGPIFYKQTRMGMDGNTFQIYKFRSMTVDAEKKSGPVWATKDDPRRTWIGRILRRQSLDELPQFYNVLKGDMSTVGPRPERPEFVNKFKEKYPQYMLRHKVKSGITGWAQVNGWRGNTAVDKRIEYDLFYIENWSLSLDLKILAFTLWQILIHKNVYEA
jgi:Undecaprenyl-phosphate glucose phosphotransferase